MKNGMNFSKKAMGIGFPFVNLQNIFGNNVIDVSNLGKAMASDSQLKDYNLLNGDVLFVRSSVKLEGVGEAALVPQTLDNTTYSGFIIRFRDEYGLDNNFKRFVFGIESVRNQIMSQATNSANKNISQSVLENLELAIPSKSEQQKIGAYFSNLDHLITLHQREFAFLCKEKSKKFRYIKNAWEQRKLLEFGLATGGTSIESEFSEDGVYKVISIGSYSEDNVYRDQGIRAVRSDKTVNRILNKGDITMILNDKTASGNIIGRVLLIEESGVYVYNQRTERIEVDNSNYDSQFIYTMLNAPAIRDRIIKQSQGNTQIYVNWTTISQTDYLVPQFSEQRKIGEYFANLDHLITLHQRKPNFYTGGYYAE